MNQSYNGVVMLDVGRGLFAVIDEVDTDLSKLKWNITSSKKGESGHEYLYVARHFRVGGKQITRYLHRIIAERIFGSIPRGVKVDHWDRNSMNNRRGNLRLASNSQNISNSGPIRRKGTDGYKGIYRMKTGRWASRIRYCNKVHSLGCYDTPEDAARAYDVKALELLGEFAYQNFPQNG